MKSAAFPIRILKYSYIHLLLQIETQFLEKKVANYSCKKWKLWDFKWFDFLLCGGGGGGEQFNNPHASHRFVFQHFFIVVFLMFKIQNYFKISAYQVFKWTDPILYMRGETQFNNPRASHRFVFQHFFIMVFLTFGFCWHTTAYRYEQPCSTQ